MKPFTDTIREINGGKFAEELNEALQELVLAVRDVGKAGVLIKVEIKLKPTRGGAFEIEHDFTVKSPDFERPSDIMFPTADGSLVRNNPAQAALDLRAVEAPSGPIREVVDQNTGEIKPVAAA